MIRAAWIILLGFFSFSTTFAASTNPSFDVEKIKPVLEKWITEIGLPSKVDKIKITTDEFKTVTDLNLQLTGKSFIDRRADYQLWIDNGKSEGEIGLNYKLYFFKKPVSDLNATADEVGTQLQEYADNWGMKLEKTTEKTTETVVTKDAKTQQIQGITIFKYTLKASEKTPENRMKIKDLVVRIKLGFTKIEFDVQLHTKPENTIFRFVQNEATGYLLTMEAGVLPGAIEIGSVSVNPMRQVSLMINEKTRALR